MPTFVQQAGVPIVTVKSQCSGNTTKVSLAQQRYFYDRTQFNAGTSELWKIPICMRAGKGQQKCELLTKKEDEFTVAGCSAWVLSNAGATGYYRSHYDSDSVRAMSAGMQSDLSPAERIRLIGDEWASVRVNLAPIGDFMALAEGLKTEHNGAVMAQGTGQIQYLGDILLTDADASSFQQWVRDLLNPLAKELGWKPAAGDSDDRKKLTIRRH